MSADEIMSFAVDTAKQIIALKQRNRELLATLKLARRAIGDHIAPEQCYATGPMTGDAIADLVECPACAFISAYCDAIKSQS